MSSPLEDQLQQAMKSLQGHREKLADTRQQLLNDTVSVRSKDRSLTAVVGMRGDLRELTFHTDAYRSMARAELSAAIVDVVNRAREQATDKVAEQFAPFFGAGAAIRESFAGGTEIDEMLTPLLATRPANETMTVREE